MTKSADGIADLGVLAQLGPELAQTFAAIAGDIALVIDSDGLICNLSMGSTPLGCLAADWVGRPFVDAVTEDTRFKIQQLLKDAGSLGVSRRREVNLAGFEGVDIPVAFSAIRLGANGPVLAVGHDLRAVAAIQQRFVEAQRDLEHDYWQQRQAETRYRQLFQVATDAVMVVDAITMVIQEANTAAADLFGMALDQMRGLLATVGIEASSRPAVDEFLATARTTGKAAEMRARIKRTGPTPLVALVDISATPFRAAVTPGADQLMLLVRARSVAPGLQDAQRRLESFVEHTPDAVVITDGSGRVQMANPAFLALCVAGMSSAQLQGRSLSDLLGDPGQRLPVLISEVRRNGIASQVRTLIRKDSASTQEVEVSAALLAEGDHECIGLILRSRLPQDTGAFQHVDTLSEAIENLDAQLGRVSLPELMQEATHLAERHLIRCALQRSGGNHATAASWLGISPESLTLRLQRNGMQAKGDSSPLLN